MTEYKLILKKINQNTPGIIILELEKPNQEAIFNFKPGQYVMISYKNTKGLIEDKHAFSIASSPAFNNSIILGIRIGGTFTQGLANLQIGQELMVSGPYGNFIFNESNNSSPVFIAGGIGITPFISSLNYICDQNLLNNAYLIYSARSRSAAAFLEEINKIQTKNPRISVLLSFTDESGQLTAPIINNFIHEADDKIFYLCGPSPFMSAMTSNLLSIGANKKNIKTEAFSMIQDQGFGAILKNTSYAASFAAALFLPIFYLINNNSNIAYNISKNTNQVKQTNSLNNKKLVIPAKKKSNKSLQTKNNIIPVKTIQPKAVPTTQVLYVSPPSQATIITQPANPAIPSYNPRPRTRMS